MKIETIDLNKLPAVLRRVMVQAIKDGRIHRAGGFNAGANQDVMLPGAGGLGTSLGAGGAHFDRPTQVDRCIAQGWLVATDAWNTYVPTEAGKAAMREAERLRLAKIEAKGRAIADRVAAQNAKRAAAKAAAADRRRARSENQPPARPRKPRKTDALFRPPVR